MTIEIGENLLTAIAYIAGAWAFVAFVGNVAARSIAKLNRGGARFG